MIGFLARRNFIIMFLSAEMMLQGVSINLVAFARYRDNLQGQAFVLFILTVAACEAAIALALILMLYRTRHSLDVSIWQDLREPGQEPTLDEEPLPPPPAETPLPHLTPAGVEPEHPQEASHV
jgi:NADH-quinone oxidoreductase subunit K